jgi:hypothetical protein
MEILVATVSSFLGQAIASVLVWEWLAIWYKEPPDSRSSAEIDAGC